MGKIFKSFSYLMVPLCILSLAFMINLAQQKEEEEKAEEEEPYIYTNEDLEKFAVEEKSAEEADEEEEISYEMVEDMIKKLKEPERIRKWKEAKIKAAEEKVKQAEMRLDYLSRKKASILNPLLPRPEPTEEDAREEAGMDNVNRLERTEKQIEEAEEKLDQLEKEYEKLLGTLREVGI